MAELLRPDVRPMFCHFGDFFEQIASFCGVHIYEIQDFRRENDQKCDFAIPE